ncbi:hypothetical protein NHX12_006191 [Muraenolepis orangiensis]|uniref:GST C-terminal domain-containing protein n=1 Tax=Muraenolepis orangiensis TaxID=630683 RepID=A0A9Q0DT10_9TELE|nr:hypothetical protein NHX12_006191 [Muraenolepis orangiensis]
MLCCLLVCDLQVDHWLEFSSRRLCAQKGLALALGDLEKALSLRTFLVGHALTLADLCVWAALKEKHLRIGAWNVRTLTDNQASDRPERRTAIISRELRKFQIDIAGLSETRLADEGQLKEEKGGYTFFWKGKLANEPRIHGVGFAIKNCLINHLHELPVGISERLMTIRLMLASSQMATVISAYAPTLDAQDEVKEAFYADLKSI